MYLSVNIYRHSLFGSGVFGVDSLHFDVCEMYHVVGLIP